MTHGSLFSGIGGFDLAAQDMGWQNIFHCEINEFCQKILKYYWPNADSYTDIKQTDFTIYRGKIDVLSGGFPCQPFSVAGQRKGTEDDRYLWPQMLRAINEIHPTWVVGENVAGLVSMVQPEAYKINVESQADFFGEIDQEIVSEYQQYVIETVCSDLERIGYSVQPVVIPACAVGAPHRRDRIWFIANRPDTGAESVRESEKRVYKPDYAANAASKGLERCRQTSFRKLSTEDCERFWDRSEQCGATITNPNDNGLHGSKNRQSNSQGDHGGTTRKEDSFEPSGCSQQANVANSKCSGGLQILYNNQQEISNGNIINTNDEPNYWSEFPTQSPVCCRDDGLPSRLDGITFPKWRAESIKSFGNAVVRQVVQQIFSSISESYLNKS